MKVIECAELRLSNQRPSMRAILDWALRRHRVNRMFFTIYTRRLRDKWCPVYPNAQKAVFELFSPFILRVFLARSWPPYDHLRHPHIVCVIRFSKEVRDIMLRREPRLAGWLNQHGLPEDICLFNSRRQLPCFVSSTLSLEGYLIDVTGIRGSFFGRWSETIDAIRSRLEIHDGYAFCRPWHSQRHISWKELDRLQK